MNRTLNIIEVKSGDRLLDIIEKFNKYFPNLRLHLLRGKELLKDRQLLQPLSDYSLIHDYQDFIIKEDMSVRHVFDLFKTKTGLTAVIFRRLGSGSVETSYTANWTLGRQNQVGSAHYLED